MDNQKKRHLEFDAKTSGEIESISYMLKGISAMLLTKHQEYLDAESGEMLSYTACEFADILGDKLYDIMQDGKIIWDKKG